VTDAELVNRARQGDADAFGELVNRHHAAVYRAALSAGASPADAEDVSQEAFLQAYRRLDGFRAEASFKTWLLTIAWNRAINERRAHTRWWTRLVSLDAGREGSDEAAAAWERIAAASGTPEELAAGSELARAVRTHIAALPRKLRDALLLAQSGEYSYDEMAAMLRAPAGTIKWRVSEARKLVKARLAGSGHK